MEARDNIHIGVWKMSFTAEARGGGGHSLRTECQGREKHQKEEDFY